MTVTEITLPATDTGVPSPYIGVRAVYNRTTKTYDIEVVRNATVMWVHSDWYIFDVPGMAKWLAGVIRDVLPSLKTAAAARKLRAIVEFVEAELAKAA